MQKHGSLLEKLHSFVQIDDFSCLFTKWGTFCFFLLKSSWKCQDMVVCSKSCKFWPNRWFFVLFHEMRHFLQLFPEKFIEMQRHGSLFEKLQRFGQMDDFSCFFTKWGTFCKKWFISWKSTKTHGFGQNLQLFEKTTMFWRLDALFSKKLQKLPHFVKKHENSSIWQKLCNFFEQTTMFWCFDELFSQRLRKVAQFVRKHEKSSIWPKLCNFSNKLPCLCISINFSGKSGSFRPEERKIIDLPKSCNSSTKLPCFGVLVFFFRKKLQKRAHFVKKHEKSSIWPKLATLRWNYHVSAFWSTFQQKVAKSGSFREKWRKIIDLAKSCNFSSQLPCFRGLVNFSAKRWKKWLISWKMHEKSSIWPKFATFRGNYHVSAFWWTFEQKVSHFVKKHEKSSIWPKLTTSRTNYHVSAFWSAFQQKVVKSIVGAYQAQAIITGFTTSICSFHLCRDWGNDFWNYVSRSTGVLG